MAGGVTPWAKGVDADILIKLAYTLDETGLKQASKRLEQFSKEQEQWSKRLTANISQYNKESDQWSKRLTANINAEEKAARRFKFQGLTILFFGMFLERVFGRILTAGTTTFQAITNATEGSMTAMNGLSAASTFLAFTIGDALNTILEPLLPTIIGIVEAVADFIQQHPELVSIIVAIAGIGTAFMVIGSLMTFFQNVSIPGLIGAFKGLYSFITITFVPGLITLFTFLMAHPIIAALVGLIALISIIWSQNWGGIREVVYNIINNYIIPALAKIIEFLTWLGRIVSYAFRTFWNVVVTAYNYIKMPFEFIIGFLDGLGILEPLLQVWSNFWNGVKDIILTVYNAIKPVLDAITWFFEYVFGESEQMARTSAQISSGARTAGYQLGQEISVPTPLYGSATVSKAGLMYMQPGEVITNTFQGGINITIETTSNMNSEDIANEILRKLTSIANVNPIGGI